MRPSHNASRIKPSEQPGQFGRAVRFDKLGGVIQRDAVRRTLGH